MHIRKIKVKILRLLADVELAREEKTTLIVGRNNSGKTSLSEVIRLFVVEQNQKFHIEDFSNACYERFCEALIAKNAGARDEEVRALIPGIELRIYFQYDPNRPDLGPLSEFVIDLNPQCNEALAVARYELRDGAIESLFAGQPADEMTEQSRRTIFQALRDRIPTLFVANIWAEDPSDPTNRKQTSVSALRSVLRAGFVNAQRGLDDNTSKDSDVLAKILESLFNAAKSPTADQADQAIARSLQEAVQEILQSIEGGFKAELQKLMPTLQTFGYPGLECAELETETRLDVERLLSRHTKVRYAGHHGVHLPESYTGLGIRNLIFILLQVVCFYRSIRADPTASGVHFIVSTHSSHVANAAGFESIRYFLPSLVADGTRRTTVKDLREGLRNAPEADRRFLHQYLTLTRCDLFFADKAILIEGTAERLLLPVIVEKLVNIEPETPKLSSQYITTMEVGGAYAHIFLDLLDFLELRTLIITDLDSVVAAGGETCAVHLGAATSNACLNAWFADGDHSLPALLAKGEAAKIRGLKRVAYQTPEAAGGPCGRTLEDALMLANMEMFGIEGVTPNDQATFALRKVDKIKKSEFALKHAIDNIGWRAPVYILDGLRWLAAGNASPIDGAVGEALAAGNGGSRAIESGRAGERKYSCCGLWLP